METILPYIQIGLSVLLIASILIQRTEAGLGGAFGGSDSVTGAHTRRGSEKVIFYATVIIAVLFAMSVLASFVI